MTRARLVKGEVCSFLFDRILQAATL